MSLNRELGAPQDTLVALGAQLNGLRPWGMEDREERMEARGWMFRTGQGTSSLSGHCWQESRRGHTHPTPCHRATAAQRFRLRGEPPIQAWLRAAPGPKQPPHP